LLSNVSEIPLRVTRDRKLAEEWELALVAQGLSPSLRWSQEGFVLSVPATEQDRAVAGLAAYEQENPRELPAEESPAAPPDLVAGVSVGAILLLFFVISAWRPELPWFEHGSADADRILMGELWRTVTALTLHANLAHALSNAIGIALFLGALSSMLGPGLASALVLVAGAGGNLVNALIHGSTHVSVGGSTSVFGAVGMLGGLGLARRGRKNMFTRRAWMPVAATLALLAMLGTGGEHVDVLAHLFGFLFGAISGILCAFVMPHPPGRYIQWACGTAAVAVIIFCWSLAFR
jgi:membrane associated rhomboid family serine protease